MKENASGWIKKSPLNRARSHAAVAVHGDNIYVFGGGGTDFQSLYSTEIYDPKRDLWSRGSDMPSIRSGAVAAVLNDKIYVIGGGMKLPDGRFEFFRIVEIYDPKKDTWTEGPEMLMPHDYPASAVMNGLIYVMGGHHPNATMGGPMTDPGFSFCEVYDPEEEEWHEIAPLPTSRFAFAAVVLNERILALGGAGLREEGFQNFDVVESYDPMRNQWSDAGFSLPWPAAGLGAWVFRKRLCIVGGNSGKLENRFTCFDPESEKWTQLPPLKEARIVMGTALVGNTAYLIGGRGGDGKTPLAAVDAFQMP